MVMAWLTLAAVALLTFLMGSVPWGLVISKVFYHKDLRNEGSGNIGTTNAMRSMGKVGGSAVFVLDFGKGIVSGLIGVGLANVLFSQDPQACASLLFLTPGTSIVGMSSLEPIRTFFVSLATAVAFLGCTLGHIFSPWLGFKGGKGIAVAAGCLFVTFGFVGGLIEILIFAVLVIATRYVSVGSLAAAIVCPFLAIYYCHGNILSWVCCFLGAAMVIWAHRGNIQRLVGGCERRIGDKKKAA